MNTEPKILNEKGEKENDSKKEFKRKDKRNGKTDKRGSKFEEGRKFSNQESKGRSFNDPKWYALNELSGRAVGSIPFNIFAGEKLDLQLNSNITDNSNKTIPGVLKLSYVSLPGRSTSAASAVNIMSKAVYSFVRHQNSGHSNYESSDLTLYILAMDEVYTRYHEAKRIYEVAMTYDYANRNIPDVILSALGVNADNIRKNLAQFRYGLNIIAAKISSMAVPANFNLFKRHAIISSAVLMDSSSMRGQFYVWAQRYTHKYNPEHTGGGALEAVAIANNRTYQDILDEINNILDPIISDEDMNIMSGDIMKAYGKENLFVLSQVDENSTANFIYDENMLAQIENARCEFFDANTLDITQNNNLIISNPTIPSSTTFGSMIFNSHKDDPNWEDTLEWTRASTLNGEFGTELIALFELTYRKYDANDQASIRTHGFTSIGLLDNAQNRISMIALSAFDWHPFVYFMVEQNGAYISYEGFYGDIKKFTILSAADVKRLHDSAVMGELNGNLLTASV